MLLTYKRLTLLLVLLIFSSFCLQVNATEYKPLEIDLPAINFHEEGTISYTIKKGDTLFSIGKRFNSDVELISALNSIENPNQIVPGQEILVPKLFEHSHQVEAGDTIWKIARLYSVYPQQIVLANDIWDPNSLEVGAVLNIPGKSERVSIQSINSTVSRFTNNFFQIPTSGVLTSLFGRRHDEFHTGIDFANEPGTPIKAASDGKVVFVGWKGNYGNTVVIDHYNGYITLYGHNSKIFVKNGQWVKTGDVIALMGNTGRSTGPHLHFEIRKNGKAVNPLNYLKR